MKILYMMSGEEHSATSLSRCMDITIPTLCHYLKMLTNANFIDMRPCLTDLRVKRLSLSEQGRALLFMYENEMIFHQMVLDD